MNTTNEPDQQPLDSGSATAPATAVSFPVVGLGASAGGLEAFERFFRALPSDSGMAFVLVQHLDPGHASILTEILQRAASLPVVEAEDQMAVTANRVYVIPPNRDMAIYHGTLQLSVPESPRGQRMAIDYFLRSLAEEQGERAIGIILSGTGTDGTLGLRAIHGAGGITLVQDPAEAAYDGMPQSAIKAGFATYVLPVEQMARQLLSCRQRPQGAVCPSPSALTGSLRKILQALRSATGHDFALYKQNTIRRRIERRMALHGLENAEVYARYLKEHPAEVQLLFKELLIGVTSFFRDPEAFAVLKKDVLPRLYEGKTEGAVFRLWVVACSSGEEAYSLAICLREYLDENRCDCKVQIYSTDIDDEAINFARAGVYPPNIAADVSPERLRRFFVKDDDGYRVKKDIREMIVFASQNVIKDPPFTRMDLVSCRNLLIYLEPELQNRLLSAFHYALRPGGVLLLSPSESIGGHVELFKALDRKWKVYQTLSSATSARAMAATTSSRPGDSANRIPEEAVKKEARADVAEQARRALLESYAPASVLTDAKGNILYVHGDTGRYLRPAPGQATLNVVDMAREGLQLGLRNALHEAVAQGLPSQCQDVPVRSNGDIQVIDLVVRPLAEGAAGQSLLMVSFQDVAREKTARARRRNRPGESRRVEELERELAYTRENLHATIEEQQATNEELKSANEEMQSTNEELQSTNEELETSKEELQSVNEELQTVNAELQAKIEQLAGMQNDMKNLFDSIRIGTVFLDARLCIRRFTREATRVYRLVSSDVGRPLADIKSNLIGEDLVSDTQEVLETLVPREQEVRTPEGQWLLARILPYRTLENLIDGVVLTFTDISELKRTSEENRLLGAALTAAANAVVVTDRAGVIQFVNPAFTAATGYSAGEVLGQTPRLLKSGTQGAAFYQRLWETILAGRVWQGEMVNRRRDGSQILVQQVITPVRDDAGTITHFVAISRDITRAQGENGARAQEAAGA
ncbi:MAG: SAM-dependent methyltransferase [Desulfobulbaceae bacterium A2]|nr:MAG: SAM-dependent methyltransferase [Desulfobulbaceae bacterium A2]